jgi:hypothetical protein
MNTASIMRIPLKTRRFNIAMIERMKQARNNTPETNSINGETKSRTTPTIRHRNDHSEGFHPFLVEATGGRGGAAINSISLF